MNTDVLDTPLPTIELAQPTAVALAAALDLKKVDLTDVALAQFGDWRAQVAAVRVQLDGVVHDLSTAAKITEAKSLRQRLINAPRAEARKTATELKSKLAQVSKAIGSEVEAISAAWDGAETLITPQIEAADAKIEAERQEKQRQAAEAARIEAERKQRLEDGIATLASYVRKAQGKTAQELATGIEFVRGIVIDPAHWQEYTAKAQETLTDTLQKLDALHAATVKAEADAAELEARRAEQQRIDAATDSLRRLQQQITRAAGGSAEHIRAVLAETEGWPVYEVLLGPLTAAAQITKDGAIVSLRAMLADAERKEQQAATAATITAHTEESGSTPGDALAPYASNEADPAQASPSGEQGATTEAGNGVASAQDSTQEPKPTGEGKAVTPGAGNAEAAPNTEGQRPQQVLKAEPATADATDRGTAADASPRGGAMGAGQAAAAAPAGDLLLQDQCRGLSDALASKPDAMLHAREAAAAILADSGSLETSEADAIEPQRRVIYAEPEPADTTLADALALVQHIREAFASKYPTQPKMGVEWWAKLRTGIEALEPRLLAAIGEAE